MIFWKQAELWIYILEFDLICIINIYLSTFCILHRKLQFTIDKDCQWPLLLLASSYLTSPPTSWWHTECWPTRSRTLRCRGSGTWGHQSPVIYTRYYLGWSWPGGHQLEVDCLGGEEPEAAEGVGHHDLVTQLGNEVLHQSGLRFYTRAAND